METGRSMVNLAESDGATDGTTINTTGDVFHNLMRSSSCNQTSNPRSDQTTHPRTLNDDIFWYVIAI